MFDPDPKLPSYCYENPIYVFPEKELRGLNLNFHIHVSASKIPFLRIFISNFFGIVSCSAESKSKKVHFTSKIDFKTVFFFFKGYTHYTDELFD
jgi:hypothetical protein